MTGSGMPLALSSASSAQPSIGSGSIRSMIATSGWELFATSSASVASCATDTLYPSIRRSVSRIARQGLVAALRSCATEADIVQVLYQYLRSAYGYDVVALTVLEREGWYHAVGVDQGILQDVQRRRLVESVFAPAYEAGKTQVIHPPVQVVERSRGPGA